MKKLVIFGFDGTLADTSPGILYCLNTTAISLGYPPVDHDALYGVIGFPLEEVIKRIFDMKDDEVKYAANNYSKLYSQKGIEMFTLYDGIADSLNKLKENGCKLAIATQKHTMFISNMLESFNGKNMFDAVCATDVGTNLTKGDLIMQACKKLGVSVEDSIIIGDSEVDAQGAEKVGMDFAAALYGWGFRTKKDAEKYNCKAFIKSANDIYLELSLI